ncbi:hypothetical protein SNEBB_002617 [Seison nebaliae]|nr:hypothetical protein SNEBB_002617 [Seison nebaliae]
MSIITTGTELSQYAESIGSQYHIRRESKVSDPKHHVELFTYDVHPLDEKEDSDNSVIVLDEEDAISSDDDYQSCTSEDPLENRYPIELLRMIETNRRKLTLIPEYEKLEFEILNYFKSNSHSLLGGTSMVHFNYILLDPRLTRSVYGKDDYNSFKNFLKSIFYIGKAKNSRPYAHLYEAIHLWHKESWGMDLSNSKISKKHKKIMEIWNNRIGVISLHVFQNCCNAEACTREAAMIDALDLNNLTNVYRGSYYGIVNEWKESKKKSYGSYLLRKAHIYLLLQGERQLTPATL